MLFHRGNLDLKFWDNNLYNPYMVDWKTYKESFVSNDCSFTFERLLLTKRLVKPGAEITTLRWISGRFGDRIHRQMVVNDRNLTEIFELMWNNLALVDLVRSAHSELSHEVITRTHINHIIQFQVLPTDQGKPPVPGFIIYTPLNGRRKESNENKYLSLSSWCWSQRHWQQISLLPHHLSWWRFLWAGCEWFGFCWWCRSHSPVRLCHSGTKCQNISWSGQQWTGHHLQVQLQLLSGGFSQPGRVLGKKNMSLRKRQHCHGGGFSILRTKLSG